MTNSNLKTLAPYAAVIGLAGLLAAGILWLLRQQVDVPVQASLAVGLLGLALALLFNPGAVQTWLLGRQARYGSNVALMMVALLGILVLVNYLVTRNPQRWDWSEDQRNTLSAETLAIIQALPQPVRAIGFYSAQAASTMTTAQTLLERYRVESGDQLTYEFHDPFAEPALVQEYNVTQDGTLVLEMGDQRETVDFVSEGELTGTLSRLLNPVARIVYYTTGAGERGFDQTDQEGLSQAAQVLGNQNYELRPINLAVTSTVPADATVLVVGGGQVPVTTEVVNVIKDYVGRGGTLVVLSDPPLQYQQPVTVTEPLVDYLRTDWGIQLDNDVVLATQSNVQGQPYAPVTFDYGSHPITQNYTGIGSIFFYARSVTVLAAPDTGIQVTPLVMAGGDAWGETTLDNPDQPVGLDEADVQPTLNLAVAAENTTTGARVVVYGDSDFATNSLFGQTAGGNLLVSSINWAAQEENLINITPRVPTTRSMVPLEAAAVRLIGFVTVLLLPAAVLVLGLVVWYQRRRRG